MNKLMRNKSGRFASALATLITISLLVSTSALANPVWEFFNTNLDHYFITSMAGAPEYMAAGLAGPGWIQTGNTFEAGGSTPVCRFYGSQHPGPNSHFYTVSQSDCEALKQLQAVTPDTEKRWNYEGLDFISTPPNADGSCATGTVPVYRSYNDGWARGVDSNHRISTSLAAMQEVVNRGWKFEGVVMCAPLCAAPQVWNGTACAVANTVTALTLIAGTANTPGSQNGPLLTASFYAPGAITLDAQGNIFVADGSTGYYDTHGLIRKLSPSGDVSTIAGSASYGHAFFNAPDYSKPQDGIGNQAIFGSILGITASLDSNLYTIDWARVVQKITPQGNVTTIAGAINQAGSNDGPALTARFQGDGIAADQQGNLFIADTANQTIRKIDTLGNVTTYAGLAGVIGDADGGLQSARFKYPVTLKFDSSGKLFVGDEIGIRVISNGSVSTIIPLQRLMQDLCGAGSLMSPDGLDVSSNGLIAIAYSNCSHVGIYRNNQLSVVLGNQRGDVDGSPSASELFFPSGVAFLPNGDLLISDAGNRNIKRYSASTNSVSLYAGQRNYLNPVDGVGSAAKLSNPFCLVQSPSGETWFSQDNHIVRKINAAGNVTTVLNEMYMACVLKVNNDGSFIAASEVYLNGVLQGVVRLYSQTGALLQTLAAQLDFPFPLSSAVNTNGDIFVSDKSGFIRKYSSGTGTISVFSNTPIGAGSVSAMAITSTGDIIAADPCSLFKVSASGAVTPFAGSGSVCTYKDGTTAQAGFPNIQGLAVGANDAIYVSDHGASVIRRIYNGSVDTIAGTPWVNETKIGLGQGSIYDPREIAYDATSNSLIIMTGNAILRAQLPQ